MKMTDLNDEINSKRSFMNSIFFSTKHDSYFKVYDEAVEKILSNTSKVPTIVEVGILHGGSLFMWRDLFGPSARIIGVDLNPEALKWKRYGFEIFIGNQSRSEFWRDFYEKVGPIDLLIDDGGHTNRQQIVTVINALHHMNPGGIIIIEDTDTSFAKEFGNPSKFSFLNFSKSYVDELYGSNKIAARKALPESNLESLRFFDSIVVFEIKGKEHVKSNPVNNGGIRDSASDFRYDDLGYFAKKLKLGSQWSERKARKAEAITISGRLKRIAFLLCTKVSSSIFHWYVTTRMRRENLRLRIYWRK
jgi:hypothetical protein